MLAYVGSWGVEMALCQKQYNIICIDLLRIFHWCCFQEHPFSNKTWDTCAVVGNGGILNNSSCGKMIDSAQFVIR